MEIFYQGRTHVRSYQWEIVIKKEEIEEALINLASLRWEFIREKEDYKKEKANPLIFENFTMLANESVDEFKKRVELYLSIITYENDAETVTWDEPYWGYLHPPGSHYFRLKWGFIVPIDCAVDYPNPYSLETLIRNPVRRIGNHCVQIFSIGKKLTISKIGEFFFLLPKGALDYQMEEQYKELFDAPVFKKGF